MKVLPDFEKRNTVLKEFNKVSESKRKGAEQCRTMLASERNKTHRARLQRRNIRRQARHFNVIPFPDELPLSFDNPALDPGPLSPAQATGGLTSDAQSTGEQRGVRSLPFRRIK